MREKIGKLLIGFVVVAIFIGVAESSNEHAKKQEKIKELSQHETMKNEKIHFHI